MCRRHGARRQPPIVALAGAIYGAYQSRKEKRTEASLQDIGIEGGKYAAVPQQSHPDTFDGQLLHEKGVPPPDYEDVVRHSDSTLHHDPNSKDVGTGMYDDGDDENKDDEERAKQEREEMDGVKMGFFERLHANREGRRMEREERREAWRAEKRAWMESRAERRAEWKAGMGRRDCGRHAC